MARGVITHGVSASHKRLYFAWHAMKARCERPTHKAYKNYGGRGIRVCEEWRKSVVAFRDWALANGYAESLSLDRIDNDGHYEPGNCRWVPMAAQSGNRQNRRLYTAWGETKSASEWLADPRCKIASRRALWHRVLIRGWDAERAISTPPMDDPTEYVPRGERQWAAKLTDVQVGEIRAALAAGERGAALARRYGVSPSLISAFKWNKRRVV